MPSHSKQPTLNDLVPDELSPTLLSYLAQHPATDHKGRYLSWAEFGFRNPTDTAKRWLAQQINRQALMQHLHIGDYRLSYCLPNSLIEQLYHIEQRYRVWQWRVTTEELLFEESITSAQLEGANTTKKVAKELLTTGRPPNNKGEMMIVNNHHLMQAVKQHLHEPLSIELIQQLHKIATLGAIDNDAKPGEFRQDNHTIIADYDGNIVHQPPPYEWLNDLMLAYCDFANGDTTKHGGFIHPIIKAIILHFLMGFIHPFGDGNGRTARALFYWYVQKLGYEFFDYISISRLLHKAPKQYAQSYIDSEQDDLDMTYFIAYQLKIILRAINDLSQLMQTQQPPTMTNATQDNLNQLDIHQHNVLTKTKKGQLLTAKSVANEHHISESTARKALNGLESLGLAKTVKNGRGKAYLLVDDIS